MHKFAYLLAIVLGAPACGEGGALATDAADAAVPEGPDAALPAAADAGPDAATPVEPAVLGIEPTSAVFAEQWIGSSRPAQVFTVTNVGDRDALALTVSVAGEHPGDFDVDASDCDALAPSASCTVTVSFTPTGAGARRSSLRVGNRGGAETTELSGTGRDPALFNRVFVSSQKYSMTLGSAQAYDAECNALATAAGLNNATEDAFIAWISSATSSAASRLGDARGFVRMDGRAFADELSGGAIYRGVEFFETGAPVPPTQFVASGTTPLGELSVNSCASWTATNRGVTGGRATSGPHQWASSGGSLCSTPQHIYCVEITKERQLVPPQYPGRLMFLTNADFPVADPDTPQQACTRSAPAGSGPVVPLVSTATQAAAEVLEDDADYVRPDGVLVGSGAQIKSGEWLSGAWQQGDGTYPTSIRRVWVGGTAVDQLGDLTCEDWTRSDADIDGRWSHPQRATDGSSWGTSDRRCSSPSMRFYCVETGAAAPADTAPADTDD